VEAAGKFECGSCLEPCVWKLVATVCVRTVGNRGCEVNSNVECGGGRQTLVKRLLANLKCKVGSNLECGGCRQT
jgi:hypothetical protein